MIVRNQLSTQLSMTIKVSYAYWMIGKFEVYSRAMVGSSDLRPWLYLTRFVRNQLSTQRAKVIEDPLPNPPFAMKHFPRYPIKHNN
jgi:hypothetical protein